jgi:DNA processing protein
MPSWSTPDILSLLFRRGITHAMVIHAIEHDASLDAALARLRPTTPMFDDEEGAVRQLVDVQLVKCAAQHVDIIPWNDPRYPQRLRQITYPPAVLYVRGTLPDEQRQHIAVVGTRRCTQDYGRPVTRDLVRRWSQHGAVIVSGLAVGIDMVAHQTTCDVGGTTIAVIASGIDLLGPAEAARMGERIVDNGGCIVSEIRCGQIAMAPFFPQRNRIISGMSDDVVLIESNRTGGAMITAEFARDQTRRLWAVPGPITSTRSAGPNALISAGRANLLTDARQCMRQREESGESSGIPSHNIHGGTEHEHRLMQALNDGPASLDALCAATGLGVGVVSASLLQLQARESVRALPGGRYAIFAPCPLPPAKKNM